MQEVILWNDDNTEYHVADVLVGTEGKGLVFEFQHSDISVETFISRTLFYMNLGYSVAWIFDYQDSGRPKCIFYEDNLADTNIFIISSTHSDRDYGFTPQRRQSFYGICCLRSATSSIQKTKIQFLDFPDRTSVQEPWERR